jgi:hypothetical protein
MQLDELPRQSQAEPGAFHLLGRRPHLAELLEDGLLVLWRDADSGVADRHFHASVARHRPDIDPACFGCELDRIRQQIQHDLPDLPLVCPNLAQPLVDRHVQRDAAPRGALADEGQGVVQGGGKVEVGQLELHPARLDLRQVENVVDQGQEMWPEA